MMSKSSSVNLVEFADADKLTSANVFEWRQKMELAFLSVPFIGDNLISGAPYAVPPFPTVDDMVLDSQNLPTTIRKYYCKPGTNGLDPHGTFVPPVLEQESLGRFIRDQEAIVKVSDNVKLVHRHLIPYINRQILSSVAVQLTMNPSFAKARADVDSICYYKAAHEAISCVTNLELVCARLKNCLALVQGSLSLGEFVRKIDEGFMNLTNDLEDPTHKGYLSLESLRCIILLMGVDKELFKIPRDEIFKTHKDARLKDICLFRSLETSLYLVPRMLFPHSPL